ncbi:GTPase-activating Rap/Ran-GAP domain-like protein 3 isoform X2 [Cylas formicarius]|uniref:GTPase-activating Rap/Ran-GAP domain-like protein 3 isoform X2 n=1 Tax=Cylas formicarius TaxID=197179 RepID=UPI0029588605|nr:GTPase-activating Rap/Ran-GAP domain-like protein 3 isoform X2 [Cylas formicarius]XP_060525675.1 GTPase-activating Rap/Ran-GAP domain-like protein 3 isoform X2 [Cylas formicarius]
MSENRGRVGRPRLQRSERVFSESHLTSWELFVRDSLLTLAWPELLNSVSSSTASDLISRRGVFSRRYYGSVEQLQQPEVDGQEHCRRFRIENGDSPGEKDEMFGSPSTPVLENPEYQTRWYFKYFLGKLHQNYVGLDNDRNPFFLSIVVNEDNSTCVPLYRAILFKKTGAQKISLPLPQQKVLTVKQILSNFPNMDKIEKGPKEIFSPDIQKDLLLLEEQEGSVNFKFGVIYMRQGQTSDDEILSNENGSSRFDQFLSLLGDKIRLKGWDKYRGGLDIKGDMTGKYSVYTIYEGHEIMFHVSTLLPYSRDNRQQVERKRHIGNDIVNIVFIDGDDPDLNEISHAQFNPTCIKSQFTHVFAVISTTTQGYYRLSVFSDEAVPLFGPSLPCPPIFTDPYLFREFLLVKLINGEKATFETPTFARKRQRTLDMLIKDLYSEHMTDARMTMLNRRAFSDVLADTPRHSRLKEDSRQIEFVRIGQALKLEAIVRGDAPTSLASTGAAGTVFKRSPWEANCFYPVFPSFPIVAADSWGENRLAIATEEGTFVVEDGNSHRPIFDKSLQIRQLNVVEPHGILLLRAGSSSKECKIYVFRLSQIEAITDPKTRLEVKEHRMERTRGVHLYGLSRSGGARLRMCVAIGKKLLMFQWKHSAAWTAWCPASDTDTVDGFTFFWELNLNETPNLVTILDTGWSPMSPSQGDILVCVGYKNHWDVVNGRTGQAQHLHTVEGNKAHLVTALDLYEDQEIQLMLCYNHTCHFQKLSESNNANAQNSSFDFHWNSVPTDIVCAFPYVIAFTPNTMEIRLIVNGNLIHTMTMPKLQLVASKNDIFFATTAPEFFSNRTDRLYVDNRQQELQKISPPSSPNASPEVKPLRIYRIPIHALSRNAHSDCTVSTTQSPQVWKSADAKLAVPEQPRVSRSATSSPIPPMKAKLQPSLK